MRVSAIVSFHAGGGLNTFDRIRSHEGAYSATVRLANGSELRVFDPIEALRDAINEADSAGSWAEVFVEVQAADPAGSLWLNVRQLESVLPTSL